MPNRALVIAVTHNAVREELKIARPGSHPWPDRPMGLSGGAGYGFTEDTLRDFVLRCVAAMKQAPQLAEVRDRFDRPEVVSEDLLGGNVTGFKQWLGFDICDQLGI